MFNKKLKTQIKDLKAKYDEVMSKNSGLYLENQTLKDKVKSKDKALEIEHEEYLTYRNVAENLDSELKKAVKFIEDQGYNTSQSEGDGIDYHFYGESNLATKRKNEIKTLNSKLIASEQFENDLKNKIAELEAENKELLNKITFRPESQPKKKPSKK